MGCLVKGVGFVGAVKGLQPGKHIPQVFAATQQDDERDEQER